MSTVDYVENALTHAREREREKRIKTLLKYYSRRVKSKKTTEMYDEIDDPVVEEVSKAAI